VFARLTGCSRTGDTLDARPVVVLVKTAVTLRAVASGKAVVHWAMNQSELVTDTETGWVPQFRIVLELSRKATFPVMAAAVKRFDRRAFVLFWTVAVYVIVCPVTAGVADVTREVWLSADSTTWVSVVELPLKLTSPVYAALTVRVPRGSTPVAPVRGVTQIIVFLVPRPDAKVIPPVRGFWTTLLPVSLQTTILVETPPMTKPW
jgi:hypothetical protein